MKNATLAPYSIFNTIIVMKPIMLLRYKQAQFGDSFDIRIHIHLEDST